MKTIRVSAAPWRAAAAGLLALAAGWIAAATPARAGVDVGVSIQVSQPGVYGRVDIGRFPQPRLIVTQPVLIVPPRGVVHVAPAAVPMWVPPGHRRHWSKHCRSYGACGVPVVFVHDGWYHSHVMPAADRGRPGRGHGR